MPKITFFDPYFFKSGFAVSDDFHVNVFILFVFIIGLLIV